jgi:hypothetical protein
VEKAVPMPKFGKRDILLHFDEETDEIIFYTVDSGSVAEIRKREFGGARSDIQWFQQQTADEAEKALSSMVFALIETFSLKKIGIRDYEALSEEARQKCVSELEAQVATNDAEAKYNLFIERHSRALREKSISSLEEAAELGVEAARPLAQR